MLGAHLGDQPLPERDGLRVGLSTRKTVTPSPIQWRTTSSSACHSRASRRSRSRRCRCPDSASAGSRRTSASRPAGGRTTPGARSSHGWSGEHWIAKSSAISSRSRRLRDEPAKLLGRAEVGMDRVVPAPSAPIAHGLPTSPGSARRVVAALAVRHADRVDRREVDDVEAELGEVAAVADAVEAAHERGKSSYHEPKRASGRSTAISYVADFAFSERSPAGAASASSTDSRSRPRRTAPSGKLAREVCCPAATLRCSSVWNEATRSTHRLDSEAPASRPVDLERAGPEVVPLGSSVASAQRVEPGRRYRTAAPSVSWPSRRSAPRRRRGSPVVRLTAQRPQSICGATSWISIRSGRVFGRGTRKSHRCERIEA